MKKTFTFIGLAGMAVSMSSSAAIIASYADGTTTDAAAFTNSTNAAAIATVSNLSSVGLNGQFTANQAGGDSGTVGVDLPGAPDNNYIFAEANAAENTVSSTDDYFGLTLTYNSPASQSLRLSFDAINGAAGRGGGLSTTYSIYFDKNTSGTFALAAPIQTLTWDGSTPSNTLSNLASFVFDLNNLGALAATDVVELRINLSDTSGLDRKNSFLKNVNLETIPEPSSALLLGLGGIALTLRRRK